MTPAPLRWQTCRSGLRLAEPLPGLVYVILRRFEDGRWVHRLTCPGDTPGRGRPGHPHPSAGAAEAEAHSHFTRALMGVLTEGPDMPHDPPPRGDLDGLRADVIETLADIAPAAWPERLPAILLIHGGHLLPPGDAGVEYQLGLLGLSGWGESVEATVHDWIKAAHRTRLEAAPAVGVAA